MAYKIKTKLRKNGGSLFALIPSEIIKELELDENSEIIIEIDKLRDLIKERCETYYATGEEVNLSFSDSSKILKGIIILFENDIVNFISNGKTYTIPIKFIEELDKINLEDE